MVRDPLAPLLTRLAPVTRLLAATTPQNAVAERARAVASLTAGDERGDTVIRWLRAGRVSAGVARDFDALTSAGCLRAPVLEPQTDRTLSHVRAASAAG